MDIPTKILPKFHRKKGDSIIVDYKTLPRIVKRNGKEGRPNGTGREKRLRVLPKRRDCEVFNRMLPSLDRREQCREAVLIAERGDRMIEPCSYCVFRHQRDSNVFAGCFRILGHAVDEKCCECHNMGGRACLGAVPPIYMTLPLPLVKSRPRATSQEACHGTFEISRQKYSESSSTTTSSSSRNGSPSSIASSSDYPTSPVMVSSQSLSLERSNASFDALRNGALLDDLSTLTILPSESFSRTGIYSRDNRVSSNHISTIASCPDSANYFSCMSSIPMRDSWRLRGNNHREASQESSVTLMQQTSIIPSTQSFNNSQPALAFRNRPPTRTRQESSHVLQDPYNKRTVVVNNHKAPERKPLFQRKYFMKGALPLDESAYHSRETVPKDCRVQGSARATRRETEPSMLILQQEYEQREQRTRNDRNRAHSGNRQHIKEMTHASTKPSTKFSGKRRNTEEAGPSQALESSQTDTSSYNASTRALRNLASEQEIFTKQHSKDKQDRHLQTSVIEGKEPTHSNSCASSAEKLPCSKSAGEKRKAKESRMKEAKQSGCGKMSLENVKHKILNEVSGNGNKARKDPGEMNEEAVQKGSSKKKRTDTMKRKGRQKDLKNNSKGRKETKGANDKKAKARKDRKEMKRKERQQRLEKERSEQEQGQIELCPNEREAEPQEGTMYNSPSQHKPNKLLKSQTKTKKKPRPNQKGRERLRKRREAAALQNPTRTATTTAAAALTARGRQERRRRLPPARKAALAKGSLNPRVPVMQEPMLQAEVGQSFERIRGVFEEEGRRRCDRRWREWRLQQMAKAGGR